MMMTEVFKSLYRLYLRIKLRKYNIILHGGGTF